MAAITQTIKLTIGIDWRRVLKDLIAYFREVQKSHETRSKSLLSLSNLASNISGPPGLMKEGGVADATNVLKQYHRKALSESNKAKTIEEDIMQQLTGLRSDLGQKIKEIKSLSGDFKNSCEKETESTRKAVHSLQESLGLVDTDPGATSGKGDPFIVKLGVERQLERQIDEENYLHKVRTCFSHIILKLMSTGVPQSGTFWSRTRVDRRWGDSKSLQRLCRNSQARSR